jgi:hypothetical protein
MKSPQPITSPQPMKSPQPVKSRQREAVVVSVSGSQLW